MPKYKVVVVKPLYMTIEADSHEEAEEKALAEAADQDPKWEITECEEEGLDEDEEDEDI